MDFRDGIDEVQSQTMPRCVSAAVQPLEPFDDAAPIGLTNPRAIIIHLEAQMIADGRKSQPNQCAYWCMALSILEQVGSRLSDQLAVSGQGQSRLDRPQ